MAIGEQTPTTEGISQIRREVVREGHVHYNRRLAYTEGLVIKIDESIKRYPSESIYRKGEEKESVVITLENSLGTGSVEFPRRFSLTDKRAIVGQRVTHSHFYELSEIVGESAALAKNEYCLKILSGPLINEEVKEKIIS